MEYEEFSETEFEVQVDSEEERMREIEEAFAVAPAADVVQVLRDKLEYHVSRLEPLLDKQEELSAVYNAGGAMSVHQIEELKRVDEVLDVAFKEADDVQKKLDTARRTLQDRRRSQLRTSLITPLIQLEDPIMSMKYTQEPEDVIAAQGDAIPTTRASAEKWVEWNGTWYTRWNGAWYTWCDGKWQVG